MRKKLTLRSEISFLTLGAAIGSMLLLGLAFLIMFLAFFTRQETDNLVYVLDTTNEKITGAMQYVQNGVIFIQRNAALQDFFTGSGDAMQEAEQQLTYSLDLFSEQNLIGQDQPFVISAYLFNNDGALIAQRFYPATQTAAQEADAAYTRLQETFRQSDAQYQCVPGDGVLDLCVRIFDDDMEQKGICILALRAESIRSVYAPLQTYRGFAWAVSDAGQVLLCEPDDSSTALSTQADAQTHGTGTVNDRRVIFSTASAGFGLSLWASVGYQNVYAGMTAIMMTFLIAMLVVFILATAILYPVSLQVTRPLKEMAEEIRAFGGENLKGRMKSFQVQEFQDISDTFNDMAERIGTLISEVYEKQLLATRAQVKYLQSQINPHFMFNVLAMLSIRAKATGDEMLYQQLHAFSKLVQGKIFRNAEVEIRMEEELELVRFYLLLQSGRFGEKLTYEISVSDERLGASKIPRLLIEPLVENAVSHGLEPKQGRGHIAIRVFEADGMLRISVSDDGVGFDQATMTGVQAAAERDEAHTQTGIWNTRRLLDVLYKERYTMQITSAPGAGTSVEITLPLEF